MNDLAYDTLEREQYLNDALIEMQKINKQIAKLTLRKEQLTNDVICALDHTHEGQKSYEYDVWKIEVKTPFVYSLNKKLYEESKSKLPDDYNPVKQSIAYSIDKKLCDKYMNEAPKKVRDTLAEFIDKKPGKASISLKERV